MLGDPGMMSEVSGRSSPQCRPGGAAGGLLHVPGGYCLSLVLHSLSSAHCSLPLSLQMMNSPLMQSLMSDPEVMRTMMNSNPAVRQVRGGRGGAVGSRGGGAFSSCERGGGRGTGGTVGSRGEGGSFLVFRPHDCPTTPKPSPRDKLPPSLFSDD